MDKEGAVLAGSLRVLDAERLAKWIFVVLCDEDPAVASDKESSPPSYLRRVYRSLDAQTRESFQDALLILLSEISGDSSVASGTAVPDSILLLVGLVFRGSPRTWEPAPQLRALVNRAGDELWDPISWRAAQTLVALGNKSEPQFWYRLFESGGDRYLPWVFAGLALRDLAIAFTWLKAYIDRPIAIEALLSRLPFLAQEHGSEEISELVSRFSVGLSEANRQVLWRYACQLGLRLTQASSPSFYGDWEASDLVRLTSFLQVNIPGERMGTVDFEAALLSSSPPPEELAGAPLSLKVFCSTVMLVKTKNMSFMPKDLIAKIKAGGNRLSSTLREPEWDKILIKYILFLEDQEFMQFGFGEVDQVSAQVEELSLVEG